MSRFQAPAQNSLKMTLPLSRSLPALLKQYCYIKRGERVRVRGHAPFYATLGFILHPCTVVSARFGVAHFCSLRFRPKQPAVAHHKIRSSEGSPVVRLPHPLKVDFACVEN